MLLRNIIFITLKTASIIPDVYIQYILYKERKKTLTYGVSDLILTFYDQITLRSIIFNNMTIGSIIVDVSTLSLLSTNDELTPLANNI